MVIGQLGEAELCFYKLLLLKSDIFENKSIDLDYLEKQTQINRQYLVGALKNLLENGLINLKNEVLNYSYVEAYRNERTKFITQQARLRAATFSSGGFDQKEKELLKSYYSDKYCGLEKDIFDELERNKRIELKVDDSILHKSGQSKAVVILYHFKFELIINRGKLRNYLDKYLEGFLINKYNEGNKYAYEKQAKEIGCAIKILINAGYPKQSLLINPAQIFPKSKIDVRPTDGARVESILLYNFVDTVLAMENQGFLTVLDIKYQDVIDKVVVHSGLIWTDPIKIKICLNDDFDMLFLKYVDPKSHHELQGITTQIEGIGKKNNENKKTEQKDGNKPLVIIKRIGLDLDRFSLEINDGEDDVPFRSKKVGKGVDKETKLFKILVHFWDFRRVIGKNNSLLAKGDWITLNNLILQTGTTKDALYNNIKRIREKFEKKNLPIKIEADQTGKYRLEIKLN